LTIKVKDYNYFLPNELIAQSPANPRGSSRLLVYDVKKDQLSNDFFYNLGKYLNENDLLVTNNSKVIPARIIGKKSTGGKIEILLIEECDDSWKVMIGGKISVGDTLYFDGKLKAQILEKKGKEAIVKFNLKKEDFWAELKKIGQAPIPPYIKHNKDSRKKLIEEYQTVYARNYGSAAAPTAGLHFTKKLIAEFKLSNINFASVDLHVSLGTFAPLTERNLFEKKLHSEKFEIPGQTVKKLIETKKRGGKIIAVGTTTTRTLESQADKILTEKNDISGSTEIFIQPGYKFRIVDGLITNFHLPKSSLMMLVAAFLESKGAKNGAGKLLEIYQYAIVNKYRFYSFGDAMLIV